MNGSPSRGRAVRFRVVPHEEGTLLPALLARRIPDLSLDEAKALVRAGGVYVGHTRVRLNTVRVVAGERVTAYPASLEVEPLDPAQLVFVHRDPHFVVLDKPAGIPVAATREHARGTLAEALRYALEREGWVRPYVGVLHRLDQGASGLVLFTIRDIANASLHRQFEAHTIVRTYRAVALGDTPARFECDLALAPLPAHRGMRVAQPGERRSLPAKTTFLRRSPEVPVDGASLLEVQLETGRTHQIRVHAAAMGHPLLGDRRYGPGSETDEPMRLHLHAHRLAFDHPSDGRRIDLEGQLPKWARATDDERRSERPL